MIRASKYGSCYGKVDKSIAHSMRIPELRAMQVPAELVQRILTLPNKDRYSVNWIAEYCRCTKDQVRSVLLNESKLRNSF